jgi:chromosomal replication initiator protein
MKVAEAIGHYFDIDPAVLHSISQKPEVAHMRFIAYYLLHNHYKLTHTQIANLYNKDHSTIIHGIKQVPELNLLPEASDIVIHYL